MEVLHIALPDTITKKKEKPGHTPLHSRAAKSTWWISLGCTCNIAGFRTDGVYYTREDGELLTREIFVD
jgi:hypothetical protein